MPGFIVLKRSFLNIAKIVKISIRKLCFARKNEDKKSICVCHLTKDFTNIGTLIDSKNLRRSS